MGGQGLSAIELVISFIAGMLAWIAVPKRDGTLYATMAFFGVAAIFLLFMYFGR